MVAALPAGRTSLAVIEDGKRRYQETAAKFAAGGAAAL